MRTALTIAFTLLIATASQADYKTCALKKITACDNTNELTLSSGFEPALKRFAGKQKVRWLGPKMTLSNVVLEVVGAGGDDRVEAAPGLYRFSAFRPHSATERGAVFVAADGKVKAAGVLHFNCAKSCDKTYNLAIILKAPDAELEKLVKAWGDDETRKNAEQGFEKDLTIIGHTEVITPKG